MKSQSHISEMTLASNGSRSDQSNTPTYLSEKQFNESTLPIALIISAITIITLCYIALNAATLVFKAGIGHQLILSLEAVFLISCTSAIWKRAIR